MLISGHSVIRPRGCGAFQDAVVVGITLYQVHWLARPDMIGNTQKLFYGLFRLTACPAEFVPLQHIGHLGQNGVRDRKPYIARPRERKNAPGIARKV